ncbi:MAG: hypothetical protein ABIR94_12725 [Rubrivivax sp.]
MKTTQTSPQKEAQPGDTRTDQREALERSEKEAARTEPKNFRDEATDDKVVEIGPDKQDNPIKGIDPDEKSHDKR